MKENLKTTIFCVTILIMFISTLAFMVSMMESREEQIWRNAENLGYIIGYQQAEWELSPFFDETIYNYRDGEIYNISIYEVIEFNSTYYPYNITFYKIDLNLQGFFSDPVSPYVNPAGTRYVTFRYCKDGPIPGPGRYNFHYFDVDFIEIIYWEAI